MCWFQGEDHPRMPELSRNCIKRWRELNPDWKVNILSNETIVDYVPEYFEIIKNSPNRSWAAKSDLLRILLLSKYGGVWTDASVYPVMPLNEFYNLIVNHTKFFTYRFVPRGSYDNRKKCETVSWFLCADEPELYLIEKWKEAFVNNFKTMRHWPYFTFHETLTELYDSDSEVKSTIDNMVQISQVIPHSGKKWENRVDSYMYKRPNLRTNM